ncbi:MAG: S8 family serine peptidase [Lachnospiraceae bacterium]
MKKKLRIKRTLAWMLAVMMVLAESMVVSAASDISGGDVVVTEEPGEEGPGVDVSGGDGPAADVSDGDEPAPDVSGEDSSEVEIPDLEEIEEMFPGLDESYTLSAEEMSEKQEVLDYSYDWANIDSQDNYIAGEVVFLAESEEEALAYAQAYNATLDSFEYGVAVIKLNADPAYKEATVGDVMRAAASLDSNLPAVWPNYIRYADDELVDAEGTELGDYEPCADPYMTVTSTYYEWYHSVVNSTIAYNAGYRGQGVTVAVLDAGASTSHEDLSGIKAIQVTSTLGTTPSGNHGANVAGLIGARANSCGGRGIAPECTLLTVKVLGDDGGSDSDIMRGINLAVQNKANIINMSLGGYGYNGDFNTTITNAYKAGVAVFCAAGNAYSDTAHYPAGYDKAISVAALNYSLNKTDFSNFGKKVKYSAPGYNMWSCFNTSDADCSYVKSSTGYYYGSMSGTSQATPIISGCAAVLWDQAAGTGSTKVDNLLKLMDKGSVKVTGSGLGNGYVDLAKALGLSNNVSAPNKPVFQTKAGTYNSQSLSVTITAEPGTTIYYSTDGKAVTYKNGQLSANAKTYSTPISISGQASITVHAIAVKNSNKLASADVSAKYTLKPAVTAVSIKSKSGVNIVAPGQKLTLVSTLTPTYAANKKLTWTVSPAGKGVTVSTSGVVSAAKTATPGTYTIKATSPDGPAGTTSVTVSNPTNPVTGITSKTKNVTVLAGKSFTVSDVKVTLKDNGTGSASSLTWVSDNTGVATVALSGTNVVITGKTTGKAKITGTAKDGTGKSITLSVNVTQPVTGLTITGSSIVSQGKSITLKADMSAKATNAKLTWTVSPADKGVTVSNGKVTASRTATIGSYTITAKATDGSAASATRTVTVTAAQTTNLSVDKKSVDIFRVSNSYGASTSAKLTVTCDTANWTATSSNSDLVTVTKSGATVTIKATGKATGSATVTIATTDGSNKKVTCKVNVKNPATKLYIAPTNGRSAYLAKGTSMKMGVYLITESGKVEASANKFTWSSSNPSAIKVDANGNVTGMSTSRTTATIKAVATDGSGLSAEYVLCSCDKTKSIYLTTYYGTRYAKSIKTDMGGAYALYIRQIGQNYGSCGYGYTAKSSSPNLSVGVEYTSSGYVLVVGANKKGRYTVTISCNDGSTAKATYTIVVQ